MDNLEKVEQAAQKFEAKAAQIENIEKAATTANETANKTAEVVNSVKSSVDNISTEVKSFSEWKVKKDEADAANQKALDQIIAWQKESRNAMPHGKKSFGEAFAEAVEANWKDISRVAKGEKFSMEIKAVGNMTTANNLTGDGVNTYRPGVVALPSHRINFRDLIPTTQSETGTYVHYKESGSEGSISRQGTPGAAKTQIDYDFTEVETVNQYIAGYARFAKQMTKNLPWFQNTLPRLLLRDFYKAENAQFWTDVTGTAGIATDTGSETDDVKRVIDAIAYQHNDNFNADYILVNHLQLAALNKALYDSQNYPGAAGVLSSSNGTLAISGVPIIAATWVTNDKGLIVDRDYLERIEVESIKVEFFEQDGDNVTKNLITARIECMEAVNLMLPASARYFDFGNES